jgi:hypothetical protein
VEKGYHMLDNEWWLSATAVKRKFKLSKEQLIKLFVSREIQARAIPSSYEKPYTVYRLADLKRPTEP